MTSFLRNCFSRKKEIVEKQKCYYDTEDYDRTYAVPMSVLRLGGLRLTRKDSTFVKFCWDVFYWFEFVNLFVVTWLELINMVQTAGGGSFQDAIEIFRMMPCVGYLLLAMAKTYKLVYNRSVYENLISELRGMWPRGRVTPEEDQIISTALRQLTYVVQGYYWCNNALLVIFLSPPFVEILKRALGYNVPLIFPFFYWFPFDPFQRVYYEVILAFQTWHGLITIWFMLCGDLLFCIFLSHITTQFDLLSVRIKKLIYVPVDNQLIKCYPLGAYNEEWLENSKRAIESFSEQQWEKKHQEELTQIISRHHALIRLSGDVEKMFSFALLVNFFNSSIIICFCGFCCVIVEKWNELVYKSFLTTALSQTWLLCWYGQRLLESLMVLLLPKSSERVIRKELKTNCRGPVPHQKFTTVAVPLRKTSEGLSDSLYSSGWYKASKKIRSSLLIMIHRYKELFDGGLGSFTGGRATLRIREGAEPIFCRARPLPYALRARVDAELDAMLRAGIIEPVDCSDWATPLSPERGSRDNIRILSDIPSKLYNGPWNPTVESHSPAHFATCLQFVIGAPVNYLIIVKLTQINSETTAADLYSKTHRATLFCKNDWRGVACHAIIKTSWSYFTLLLNIYKQ